MTIRPGQGYYDEVGSFFNALAGPVGGVIQGPMGGVIGAPYPYPMPPQYAYPPPHPYYPPPPPPPPYPTGQYHGIPSARIIPSIPGVPAVGVKLQPLGFSDVVFTATSGTALPAETRPQKPFKGRRLVVEIARTGASATALVKVTSITVGTNNQFVSTQSTSAGAYAGGNFDVNVELSACTSALDIAVNYSIRTAPAMADTIEIGTTLFGESVGS
jgi:hypothetical protein